MVSYYDELLLIYAAIIQNAQTTIKKMQKCEMQIVYRT